MWNAVRWIENLNLVENPFLFHFRSLSTTSFGGYFHAHQGIELLYIHQGRGVMIVDRKVHPLESGTLVCLQPYQLHRIEMDITEDSPYERTIIVFEPTTMESPLKQLPLLLKFLVYLHQDELPAHIIPKMNLNVHFTSLLDQSQSRFARISPEEHEEESQLFVMDLLQCLRDQWQKQGITLIQQTTARPVHHVEQILQWLETHYMEPFQLELLAGDLHLSKFHVSRLFRQATGSSITEYLLYRRIREACLLLSTTELSVQDIGCSIGIEHFSHFCFVFKKLIGTTPHQYRKKTNQSFALNPKITQMKK